MEDDDFRCNESLLYLNAFKYDISRSHLTHISHHFLFKKKKGESKRCTAFHSLSHYTTKIMIPINVKANSSFPCEGPSRFKEMSVKRAVSTTCNFLSLVISYIAQWRSLLLLHKSFQKGIFKVLVNLNSHVFLFIIWIITYTIT